MPTELRWIVSVSASAMHAAWAIRRGLPLVDRELALQLAEPTGTLVTQLEARGLDADAVFDHLGGLCAGIDNNTQLALAAVQKVAGLDTARRAAEPIGRAISGLESAFRRGVPGVIDTLPSRAGPLRMQWEARGPGLLTHVGRLCESEILAERADVILVHPALGGGGLAHRPYNLVRIEALLADADAALPEMVRLGWMLATLNLDLPRYSERLPSGSRDVVADLAMMPAVLAGAETVGIARLDAPTLDLALAAWLPHRKHPPETAATLLRWWEIYTDSRPGIAVALGALAKMLP